MGSHLDLETPPGASLGSGASTGISNNDQDRVLPEIVVAAWALMYVTIVPIKGS